MNARRILLCLAVLPAALSSSGCGQASAAILSEPHVQNALLYAGQESFKIVFRELLDRWRASHPSSEPGSLPSNCSDKDDTTDCYKAAQVAAARATDAALPDVKGVSETPLGKVQFNCERGESQDACETRFKVDLARAAEARAQDQRNAERGEQFVAAWPECQDRIANDSTVGGDIVSIRVAADECMTKAGFGVEVAAINRLYVAGIAGELKGEKAPMI